MKAGVDHCEARLNSSLGQLHSGLVTFVHEDLASAVVTASSLELRCPHEAWLCPSGTLDYFSETFSRPFSLPLRTVLILATPLALAGAGKGTSLPLPLASVSQVALVDGMLAEMTMCRSGENLGALGLSLVCVHHHKETNVLWLASWSKEDERHLKQSPISKKKTIEYLSERKSFTKSRCADFLNRKKRKQNVVKEHCCALDMKCPQ
jgi:hypothetical protein